MFYLRRDGRPAANSLVAFLFESLMVDICQRVLFYCRYVFNREGAIFRGRGGRVMVLPSLPFSFVPFFQHLAPSSVIMRPRSNFFCFITFSAGTKFCPRIIEE
jgi:hypothetical protein